MSLETGTVINDLNPANPPGTDPVSQGDDHIRLLKTAVKQCFAGFSGAVIVAGSDGGVVNNYILAPSTPLLAYGLKMTVLFIPTVNNTGPSTINVSGLGAKDLRSVSGDPLVANDLVANQVYAAVYDGTLFKLAAVTKNYIDNLVIGGSFPTPPSSTGTYYFTFQNGVFTYQTSIVPDFLFQAQGVI